MESETGKERIEPVEILGDIEKKTKDLREKIKRARR